MTSEGQAPDANGSRLAVVYSGNARAWANVEAAQAILREAGLSPVLLDDPDGTLLYITGGTRPVRIGVPPAEAERAAKVLAQWDGSAVSVVEEQSDIIARDVAFTFPFAVAASLATGLVAGWGNVMRAVLYGFGAWMLAFLVVSNIPGLHNGGGTGPPSEPDLEYEDD